ncbi:MAG: 50S ribosomal protein L4 [Rhodanobacteraceae bacterium]
MEINVTDGKPMKVSDTIFGADFRESLIHQVVVAYRNGGRAGTKAQLSRGEMSGTTKKSKAQKGGGARHGALTAPIFVGGGRTFAAKPRDHSQKVNRKMYRGALRSILAELNRQDRLSVVNELDMDTPSSKGLLAKLGDAVTDAGRLVVVSEAGSEALYLSARNLRDVHVIDADVLDPVSLVGANKVVMTVAAVKKIEERLG